VSFLQQHMSFQQQSLPSLPICPAKLHALSQPKWNELPPHSFNKTQSLIVERAVLPQLQKLGIWF
jgi:hypothetical protein